MSKGWEEEKRKSPWYQKGGKSEASETERESAWLKFISTVD